MADEPVLQPGEWEALLLQTPGQVHRLVVKLALHHRHVKPCEPAQCPVCGKGDGKPEQLPLVEVER